MKSPWSGRGEINTVVAGLGDDPSRRSSLHAAGFAKYEGCGALVDMACHVSYRAGEVSHASMREGGQEVGAECEGDPRRRRTA